jgi:hypothetical protein
VPVLKASLKRNRKTLSFHVGFHGDCLGFGTMTGGASTSLASAFILRAVRSA